MPEKIRLVIWDLDDTFWTGTVSEGGIEMYSQTNHDMVISLARRGIMSSICSKNDFDVVERILKDKGVWHYFIFPSIDWTPKGGRVASIIEQTGLRSSTVLFVDDNHLNIAEAEHFCPGIQTALSIYPSIVDNDLRFQGKDDPNLTRLDQYKVLEAKSIDKHSASDNAAFLRSSGIKVYIDHNIEGNLERAIELINRTNQLNYTKVRLSEDITVAKEQLLQQLEGYDVGSGLVFATDKYGDYGCIGFYLMNSREVLGRRLRHYCFSCRTLGMRIEQWLFKRLGEPKLNVQGKVLTDLTEKVDIDWIDEVFKFEELAGNSQIVERLNQLIVHGGCDVRAIEHYLEPYFEEVVEEMNDIVDGLGVRCDHSVFLEHYINGISEADIALLSPLGIRRRHFESRIPHLEADKRSVVLLSLWSDGRLRTYRDRRTNIDVPAFFGHPKPDYTKLSEDDFNEYNLSANAKDAISYLQQHFDFVGYLDIDRYRGHIRRLLDIIGKNALVIFIQTPTFWYRGETEETFDLHREAIMNGINMEQSNGRDNIKFLNPSEFAESRADYHDFMHFSRGVYFRMSQEIKLYINHHFFKGNRINQDSEQTIVAPVE